MAARQSIGGIVSRAAAPAAPSRWATRRCTQISPVRQPILGASRASRAYATQSSAPAYASRQPITQSQSLALSLTLVFASSALGFVLASTLHAKENERLKKAASFGGIDPDGTGPGTNHPTYGSPEDYQKAIAELREIFGTRTDSARVVTAKAGAPAAADGTRGNEVGEVEVSTDEGDLESHGVSEWSYHGEYRPTAVVFVKTTEDIQAVVKVANKYKVPITPYAGGTSLEGHFSSPFGGVSLDVSGMDKILRISEEDGDCTVQCGVKYDDLNAHLAEKGIPLFFPIDPGPGATIGGMIGTGCSGTNAVRYGTAKGEWFLNATVVLPNGEIIKTRQRARKSSAGWDATKIFIGAEGTLGIVTEATLKLTPKLPTKVAIVTFDGGPEAAVKAATDVVAAGLPVQCVEFMDDLTMRAINEGGLAGRSDFALKDTLFFKLQGSDESMKEVSRTLKAITAQHGGRNFEFAKTEQQAEQFWAARKAALWSILGLQEGARVWTTDVCVPISKIATLIQETKEDFIRRGITACHLGHVGDGNVHSLALFKNDEELAVIKEAVHDMVIRAQKLDGTCTGEHSVGLGKIEYLPAELGEGTVRLMEQIKRSVDPHGLMNPGKLYPNRTRVASH